ncbi:MAG: transporter associated domain-containing protein [Planctomycetia bacterium]
MLAELERIPATGDVVQWRGLAIEVVDMDGRRIDKLLVRRG